MAASYWKKNLYFWDDDETSAKSCKHEYSKAAWTMNSTAIAVIFYICTCNKSVDASLAWAKYMCAFKSFVGIIFPIPSI